MESETALGETIFVDLSVEVARRGLRIEETFSPESWECVKESLLELVLGLRYEAFEDEEEDGNLGAPMAAMDAMKEAQSYVKVLVETKTSERV